MQKGRIGVIVAVIALAAASQTGAQQVRSFAPERRPEQKVNVPRAYLPPKGMCRIWIDSVPARQQPAPTDCATAIRNKPQNGQVIFSEERDRGKDDNKKGKDRPKKPGE